YDALPVDATTGQALLNPNTGLTAASIRVDALQSTVVYVNPAWAGTAPGADPDSSGPAKAFGTDAFATLAAALAAVPDRGTVEVEAGTYTGDVSVGRGVTLQAFLGGTVTLNGTLTLGDAALDLAGQSVVVGALAGTGTVSLSGGTLTVGGSGGSTTFAGTIGGT